MLVHWLTFFFWPPTLVALLLDQHTVRELHVPRSLNAVVCAPTLTIGACVPPTLPIGVFDSPTLPIGVWPAMAPKGSKKVEGVQGKQLKDKLAEAGETIDATNLKNEIDSMTQKDRDKLASSLTFSLKGDPFKLKQYKSAKDKRSWMVDYVLDPTLAKYEVTNEHAVEQSTVDEDDGLWMTLSEYGGPKGINDMNLARIAIADYDSRPHKQSPSLRAAGVKQYKVWTDRTTMLNANRFKSAVKGTAELGEDQAVAAIERMQTASGSDTPNQRVQEAVETATTSARARTSGGKRRRLGGEEPAQLSEDDKAFKAFLDNKTKQMKGVKSAIDKYRIELKDVSMTKDKVAQKAGWGKQAAIFLQEKTDEQLEKVPCGLNLMYTYTTPPVRLLLLL